MRWSFSVDLRMLRIKLVGAFGMALMTLSGLAFEAQRSFRSHVATQPQYSYYEPK